MADLLIDILKIIGMFFINPLLYLALFMAIFLGYVRVKRERKFFHRRIVWGWSEFTGSIKESLVSATLITILSVLIGIVLPTEILQILIVVSIIGILSYYFLFLSPGITIPVTFLLFILADIYDWEFTIFNYEFVIDSYTIYSVVISLVLLTGLLLICEGLLIQKNGANYASPIVEKTKRGKKAVAYFSKKIWLLPLILIVPGDLLDNFFPYWPQFSLGFEQFSIVLFPFIIGFQQKTRKTLPMFFYYKLGKATMILGEVVMILGLVSYFVPVLSFITIALAFVGRFVISIVFAVREKRDVYAVSAKSNGVSIVAVLPESPAMKMGLLPGEIITKVNGIEVHNENELYEALQKNAAHCKIEVLDYNNELRLAQHVVYSHDHYRIGLLIAE